MSLHVIVGAGPIGSSTALLLASTGHDVRIVTRSGSGPEHPRIKRISANATNSILLGRIATDAEVLYNCACPPYTRWSFDWPPLAASLLATAETTGSVLVTMSNLYGYGPVDHPMTEFDPLAATYKKGIVRSRVWNDALVAHKEGRVRATEARASDFFGPGLTNSSPLGRVMPQLLKEKALKVFGNPDALHSWTYVPDVAKTLVLLGTDKRAWGRPWHVPTNPPLTQRQLIEAMAQAAGLQVPEISSIPKWSLRVAGLFSSIVRELDEVAYQFEEDFILDSSSITATFGLTPTPMGEALDTSLAWWRKGVCDDYVQPILHK